MHGDSPVGVAWVLHRDPSTAAGLDQLGDEVDRLREAVADHDALGIGVRATHPIEILGERLPELLRATAVQVGTASFVRSPHEILEEFTAYLKENSLSATDLTGALRGVRSA